jgi:hypothetical protein
MGAIDRRDLLEKLDWSGREALLGRVEATRSRHCPTRGGGRDAARSGRVGGPGIVDPECESPDFKGTSGKPMDYGYDREGGNALYDFHCASCGRTFEELGPADARPPACPACGERPGG